MDGGNGQENLVAASESEALDPFFSLIEVRLVNR